MYLSLWLKVRGALRWLSAMWPLMLFVGTALKSRIHLIQQTEINSVLFTITLRFMDGWTMPTDWFIKMVNITFISSIIHTALCGGICIGDIPWAKTWFIGNTSTRRLPVILWGISSREVLLWIKITAQATVRIQLLLFILRTVMYPVDRVRCKVWHTARTMDALIQNMNKIRSLLRLTGYRISVIRKYSGMSPNRSGLWLSVRTRICVFIHLQTWSSGNTWVNLEKDLVLSPISLNVRISFSCL